MTPRLTLTLLLASLLSIVLDVEEIFERRLELFWAAFVGCHVRPFVVGEHEFGYRFFGDWHALVTGCAGRDVDEPKFPGLVAFVELIFVHDFGLGGQSA